MSRGKAKGFRKDEHDTLWFEDLVYVPNNVKIRKLILQEAHDSPYSIHPGNTKMYLDLKERFWWTGMKKDIAEYMSESQGRTPEASRITTAYADTQMEVGISLAWISLLDFPEPERDMILSG